MNRVSRYVQTLRRNRKISQRELAFLLDMGTGQFISNIERGIAPLPLKYVKALTVLIDLDIDRFKSKAFADYKDYVRKAVE